MQFVNFNVAEFGKIFDATRPVVDTFIAREESEGRPARAMIHDIADAVEELQDKTPNDLMREAILNPVRGINR
jgi:uncharacterized sporulation protein YeaH/YhbH (DUF444 family)